jgi:hypothetical protein
MIRIAEHVIHTVKAAVKCVMCCCFFIRMMGKTGGQGQKRKAEEGKRSRNRVEKRY